MKQSDVQLPFHAGVIEQPPVTVANGRIAEQREQPVVEPLQCPVGPFERSADEVRRDALPATFELTLVEEPEPGRQVGDHRSRLVHPRRECKAARGSS